MNPVVVFALLFVLWVVISIIRGAGSTASFAGLLKNGTPALGILLRVEKLPIPVEGARGVETRSVSVDVEIPGEAPFVMAVQIQFYTNLRAAVLPGATVELRIDPKNRRRIAIVGPGAGFDAAGLLANAPASNGQSNP